MGNPQKATAAAMVDDTPVCPDCQAEALNRYGRIRSGKQRYMCLVCGRQFVVPNERRALPTERPLCPECGRPTHVYAREPKCIRFRCSGYPACRTYVHIPVGEGD